jgi:hypothetical protein
VPDSPLPWTGDYLDGLGNKIRLLAYANPENIQDERRRADGFGLARFNLLKKTVTFECWPRFPATVDGAPAQFPGWPVTVPLDGADGRRAAAWLPELQFAAGDQPVIEVTADATGEVLYRLRIDQPRFQPPVFAPGRYTVRLGRDVPDAVLLAGVEALPDPNLARSLSVPTHHHV